MPRLVIHTATAPAEVKTKSGDSVWICRCGLTDNEDGTCNSNHKKLKVAEEDPKKIYEYDEDGKRHQLAEECCGEDCCKDGDEKCCSDGCCEDDDEEKKDDKKESGCCGACGGCCRDED